MVGSKPCAAKSGILLGLNVLVALGTSLALVACFSLVLVLVLVFDSFFKILKEFDNVMVLVLVLECLFNSSKDVDNVSRVVCGAGGKPLSARAICILVGSKICPCGRNLLNVILSFSGLPVGFGSVVAGLSISVGAVSVAVAGWSVGLVLLLLVGLLVLLLLHH